MVKKLQSGLLYSQAKNRILQIIEEEGYGPGDKIPSENKLSDLLGVSRNTIREAIRSLEQEGILISRQGIGTFLVGKRDNLKTNIAMLSSTTLLIEEHGYTAGTSYIEINEDMASVHISDKLKINEGDPVIKMIRVRTADDDPVVYVEDYILFRSDFERNFKLENEQSLLEFLARRYGWHISYSICSIKSVKSSSAIAEHLQIEKDHPLLLLRQTHFTKTGKPVLYSDSYFVSEKFSFNIFRKT